MSSLGVRKGCPLCDVVRLCLTLFSFFVLRTSLLKARVSLRRPAFLIEVEEINSRTSNPLILFSI